MGKKKAVHIKKEIKREIKKEDEEDEESDNNNYKEDGFVVNDNEEEADAKEPIEGNGKDEEDNSLGSSDLEIIPSSMRKKKLFKMKKPDPGVEDNDEEDIIEHKPVNAATHRVFKLELKKKHSALKENKPPISKIYSNEELESEYATPYDNKLKLLDFPERLLLRYKEEDLMKLKLSIDSEIDWLFEQMKTQLISIDSIQSVSKKIGLVLEWYKKDFFDIPYIVSIKRPVFEPELTPNDIWKIYELDREWQTMSEYKSSVRKQFNVIKRFLSEKEADFMAKRHIEAVKSIEDLAYMEKFISFVKDSHIDEMKNVSFEGSSSKVQLRPVRRSMVEEAKKSNIIGYAKKFAMTAHDLAINLELILKNESRLVLIPSPEPLQSPPTLAEQYKNQQFDEVIKVMTQACKYLALEMSSHPFIRQYAMNYFKANCFLSTEPTNKGSLELDAFHPSFRTKRILRKPINLFTNDLYLDIHLNEKKGLIKTHINIYEADEEFKDIADKLLSAYMPQANFNALNENEKGWKIMREEAIRIMIKDILLEQFQAKIKQELLEKAERYVINECANSFSSLLSTGPYRKFKLEDIDKNEDMLGDSLLPKVMSFVYDQGSRCTYCVLLSEYGEIIDQYEFYHLAERQYRNINPINQIDFKVDHSKLKELLLQFKPDLIVIGASDIQCRTVKENIISCEPALMSAEEGMPQVWVTFGDLMIPRIYSTSCIADKEFPKLSCYFKQAISMGRFKQNPMEEVLQLWHEDINKNSCLKISMHPLQVMVNQTHLAHTLETKAIQIANSIGVEINKAVEYPHLRSPLSFISGLGPRKAQYIIEKLLQTHGISMRVGLLVNKVIDKKIMLNCNSFIKIKPNREEDGKYDLLDLTRIPIEMYPLANKLIKAALEDEDVDEADHVRVILRDPKRLDLLDLNDYIKKQSEYNQSSSASFKYIIHLIKRELNSPYHDPRKDYHDPTPAELFQLLVGDDNKKIGHITIAKVTRVEEQSVKCRLMNDLDASLWVRDVFDESDRGSVEKMKEMFKEGVFFEARIKSIDYMMFKVDLITKPSVMINNKSYLNLNELDYFDLREEDYLNYQYQIDDNKEDPKYIPRKIKHEKFKNITYQGCIESLCQKEIGEYMFRPSTLGVDHLTLSYKFYRHTYSHIDIIEEDKEVGCPISAKLRIGHETYSSLSDIIERFIQPCNRMTNEIIQSRKFQHVERIEDMEAKLEEEYKKNQSLIHYYLTILRAFPRYIILSYITKAKSVTTEYVKVKPKGLHFHEEYFKDIDELITFFKKNFGSSQYSDFVSNAQPPQLEYHIKESKKENDYKKVDSTASTCRYCHEEGHLIADCPKKGRKGGSYLNEKRARSPNNNWDESKDEGGDWGVQGEWGSSFDKPKAKKGCFNCGEDGHMSRECPNPKKERLSKCFNCNEEGHMSKDCPNPRKERGGGRGPMKCFNCDEEGHQSKDCPNPRKERGGGRGPMKCFNCNEEGHQSRDCPNPRKERQTKCFNCNENGHMSKDCPNPRKERGGGGRGPMKCFNCNEEGHQSRDCPNPKKDRPNKCFNCNEEGHMSRDCPNPTAERGFNNRKGGYSRDNNPKSSSLDAWGLNNDDNNAWNSNSANPKDNQSNSNNFWDNNP